MTLMYLPLKTSSDRLALLTSAKPDAAPDICASHNGLSSCVSNARLEANSSILGGSCVGAAFDKYFTSDHWSNVQQPHTKLPALHGPHHTSQSKRSFQGPLLERYTKRDSSSPDPQSMWRNPDSSRQLERTKRQQLQEERHSASKDVLSSQTSPCDPKRSGSPNSFSTPRYHSPVSHQAPHARPQPPRLIAPRKPQQEPERQSLQQRFEKTSSSARLQGSIERVVAGELSSDAVHAVRSPRMARPHVHAACSNCKKAHLSCDASRPCRRCVTSLKQDTCYDVEHKKRGRPRLRNLSGSQQPTMVLESWESRGSQNSSRSGLSQIHRGGSTSPASSYRRRSSFAQPLRTSSGWISQSPDPGPSSGREVMYSRPVSASSTPLQSPARHQYASHRLPPLQAVEPPTSASLDSSRSISTNTPTFPFPSGSSEMAQNRSPYARSYREMTASSSSQSPFGSFGDIASSLPASADSFNGLTRTAHEPTNYQSRPEMNVFSSRGFPSPGSGPSPPSSWVRGSFAVSPRSTPALSRADVLPALSRPDVLPAIKLPVSNREPLPTLQPPPNASISTNQLQSLSPREQSQRGFRGRDVRNESLDERRKKRRYGS